MGTLSNQFQTRDFILFPWQVEAVQKWVLGDGGNGYRGTLEIFTGGGKTIMALACAEEAAKISQDFRLVIVTPTIALAEQWVESIVKYTMIDRSDIVRVTRTMDSTVLERFRVLVVVINTATKMRDRLRLSPDTMLIVDECHRAGAPTFKAVLGLDARFRLGLSATPEREEVDEEGEPLRFDEQIVAKRLGTVVFSFNLSDARKAGWLPEYKIVHHGLSLKPAEQLEYDRRSRKVEDFGDRMRELGIDPSRARSLYSKKGEIGDAARAYLAAVGSRKDLLYRAEERNRIARKIVASALLNPTNRVIMFNERIEAATTLYNDVSADSSLAVMALEHSKLPAGARRAALEGFRSGAVRVLISAKSLIEGIDIPHANIGVSVASTGSVRQRIQALGRVLRRYSHDGLTSKQAEMHLLYVADTVDEAIYEKEDWSDLTGESLNEFLRWPLEPDRPPVILEGPPRRPKPTEDQEFQRLADSGFPFPTPWFGAIRGQEYRVDTRENVSNAFKIPIANSQGVAKMVQDVRGTPGGKFFVTPHHRIVLVSSRVKKDTIWFAAGALQEPFIALKEPDEEPKAPPSEGSQYNGPLNSQNGQYKLRSRRGGSIERRVARGASQFAVVEGQHGNVRLANAACVLDSWRKNIHRGIAFFVNDRWDAWYRDGGVPKFLAHVPNGFEWPEKEG